MTYANFVLAALVVLTTTVFVSALLMAGKRNDEIDAEMLENERRKNDL